MSRSVQLWVQVREELPHPLFDGFLTTFLRFVVGPLLAAGFASREAGALRVRFGFGELSLGSGLGRAPGVIYP